MSSLSCRNECAQFPEEHPENKGENNPSAPDDAAAVLPQGRKDWSLFMLQFSLQENLYAGWIAHLSF